MWDLLSKIADRNTRTGIVGQGYVGFLLGTPFVNIFLTGKLSTIVGGITDGILRLLSPSREGLNRTTLVCCASLG